MSYDVHMPSRRDSQEASHDPVSEGFIMTFVAGTEAMSSRPTRGYWQSHPSVYSHPQ